MPGSDRSDHTIGRELVQAVEWKREVRVGSNPGMVEGFASMRVDEGTRIGARRNLSKAHIPAANVRIEWRLPWKHERRGGDERNASAI